MFWDNFYTLCETRNTSPNAVCKELGLSTATATHWKNGTMPKGDALFKIAEYFNVSTDYLLGRTSEPNITATNIENRSYSKEDEELLKLINGLSLVDKAKVIVLIDKLNAEKKPSETQIVKKIARGSKTDSNRETLEVDKDFFKKLDELEEPEF